MAQLKISKLEDVMVPVWHGHLEAELTHDQIEFLETDWKPINDTTDLLARLMPWTHEILEYFDGETVLEDLLTEGLGDVFFEEWPSENIHDPEFLKKALSITTVIHRYKPGHVSIPCADDRLCFGKIIVNLDKYLLSPPLLFVGNNDWPATDIIQETDHEFLDATFYLNSSRFGTAYENKTKQPHYVMETSLRLNPLFSAN